MTIELTTWLGWLNFVVLIAPAIGVYLGLGYGLIWGVGHILTWHPLLNRYRLFRRWVRGNIVW